MHHKVGTTRIVIEQANSTAKQQSGYLQRTTPALQFDLLGTIARVSFLMTNFSAPLTTGVRVGSIAGRACRGGVQWMAQPEPETIDARKQPHLWCTKTQLELHQRLLPLLMPDSCGLSSQADTNEFDASELSHAGWPLGTFSSIVERVQLSWP